MVTTSTTITILSYDLQSVLDSTKRAITPADPLYPCPVRPDFTQKATGVAREVRRKAGSVLCPAESAEGVSRWDSALQSHFTEYAVVNQAQTEGMSDISHSRSMLTVVSVRPSVPLPILLQKRVCRNMPGRCADRWQRQQVGFSSYPRRPSHLTSMNRFILANTEQLHEKIKIMSERIRKLEEALKEDHSHLSSTEHPLLRQDLLLIKKSPELFGIDQQQQAPPSEGTPDTLLGMKNSLMTGTSAQALPPLLGTGTRYAIHVRQIAPCCLIMFWMPGAHAVRLLCCRINTQRSVQTGRSLRGVS